MDLSKEKYTVWVWHDPQGGNERTWRKWRGTVQDPFGRDVHAWSGGSVFLAWTERGIVKKLKRVIKDHERKEREDIVRQLAIAKSKYRFEIGTNDE